jgi:hypothetical protein
MKQMKKIEKLKQKQKIGICIGIGLLITGLLSACGTIQELYYQGKTRPINEVEEMLSDYIESENPNLDVNVEITHDID